MAQITGAQGADLTQKLSQYLVDNAGLIDSTTVANLLNQFDKWWSYFKRNI
jgi:3-phenylpropionate/cinnamic acid dioxygenase small subunit